jgi:phosphoenolpyruvate carboxykinase (GTP)
MAEDVQIPITGYNHSGPWWKGKKDPRGKEIPISHDNARFTMRLTEIQNFDATQVVPLEGIIYGGRSAKRPVPVSQSYGWIHGVFYGASIESEPTAATVGAGGPKVIVNPMANKEFVSIPIGSYLKNHIQFGKDLKKSPRVFYVNYFLRDDEGNFLNTKMDKKVWVRWIERRINQKMDAYATPTGWIPKYEDLAKLFKRELSASYSREDYERQFMTQVKELLDKLDNVEEFYRKETSVVPKEILDMIEIQRRLLLEVEKKYGPQISPFKFKDYAPPEALATP